MAKRQDYLGPAETAAQFGIGLKALRLYEQRGLLTPYRTAKDWRLYGPDQQARLQEIVALKALGLSLAQIGRLLAGEESGWTRALALQAAILRERRLRIDRALALITAAQAEIAGGATPSEASLKALSAEVGPDRNSWNKLIQHFYRRHFDEDEWATVAAAPQDEDWATLIETLRTLTRTQADPASPGALTFMQQWIDASNRVAGGKLSIHEKAHAAWMEALADPATASTLPLGQAEIDYLALVGAALAAQG